MRAGARAALPWDGESAMKVVSGIEGAISFTGWSPVMAAALELGRESGSPFSLGPVAQ
jgi:hypothetical protein